MEERQTIQRNGELWRTVRLPPVILAIAALITAITGLIKVLKSKKK